jgi:hypothetical protein
MDKLSCSMHLSLKTICWLWNSNFGSHTRPLALMIRDHRVTKGVTSQPSLQTRVGGVPLATVLPLPKSESGGSFFVKLHPPGPASASPPCVNAPGPFVLSRCIGAVDPARCQLIKGQVVGRCSPRIPKRVTFTHRLHEDEATFVINHNHSKISSGPFLTYSILTQAPSNLTCLVSRVLLVSFIQPTKVQYLSLHGRGTRPFPVVLISL